MNKIFEFNGWNCFAQEVTVTVQAELAIRERSPRPRILELDLRLAASESAEPEVAVELVEAVVPVEHDLVAGDLLRSGEDELADLLEVAVGKKEGSARTLASKTTRVSYQEPELIS